MDQSFLNTIKTIAIALLKDKQPLTAETIRRAVGTAVGALGEMGTSLDGADQEEVARAIEAQFDIWVPDGTELLDPAGHVPWLPDKRSQVKWDFWHRYEVYLAQQKGMHQPVISRLDTLTDRILENLEDPERKGTWDRRGVVVGQVQSGKTANYTGLICKAVDAGYKLIIVLAGMHNSLRSQTQLRLDEGFLGRDTKQSRVFTVDSAKIGVGLVTSRRLAAHSLTTSADDGDFKKAKAKSIATYIGSDPVILVVKKNASVLKNLLSWVQSTVGEKDDNGRRIVKNLPVLLLDDEADSASVNTKEHALDSNGKFKDIQDATAINKLIRRVLNTFDQSAYVGYTATPFANIFIHPDITTQEEGEDLFPRSFILNLPAPSNYIGPVQVFGLGTSTSDDIDVATAQPVVAIVDDSDDLIPANHRQFHPLGEIPNSMKEAIRAFVISCAARRARGQSKAHNSMLIHVTRFNAVQRQLDELVSLELRTIKYRIEYGDGDRQPSIIEELRELWERDYGPSMAVISGQIDDPAMTRLTWQDVEKNLKQAALKINVKVINGDVGDVLDYYDHPNGISVIAIGGDKLSRGLTLEGLTVSYYLRASKMYDTLMQMGRWFGYRPGYADLCRLYTTQELVDWYEHITLASEALREEFDRMASARMTPRDYGLKVQTHPGSLMVTSAGKMRYSRTVRVSFAASLIETYFLQKDEAVIDSNFATLCSFVDELGAERVPSDGDHIWTGVRGSQVTDFLERLIGHSALPTTDPKKLAEYITTKISHGELVDWTVVLIDNKLKRDTTSARIGHLDRVGLTTRTPDGKRSNVDTYAIRNRHIITMDDEILDLSSDERRNAQEAALAYWNEKQPTPPPPPAKPGGSFIRAARPLERGLLLLYPLNPKADELFDPTDRRYSGNPITGFAISFPGTKHPEEAVEYAVNTVYWQEEMEGPQDEVG